jgi:alcohol dehydrogenase class IV
MVVTDRFLFNNGYADEVVRLLKKLNMEVEVFYEVEADPPCPWYARAPRWPTPSSRT